LWRPTDEVPTMHGAVVAWRSLGREARCDRYSQPLTAAYWAYTFPYQADDLQGYCWSGYILRDEMYHALAEEKRGGQEQLASAIMQRLLKPTVASVHKPLTIHDVVFDQKHAPHAGIFDVPMLSTDEPFALQVSSSGVHMMLLLAGDAAITPWFPRSVGLNAGAERAVDAFEERRIGPDGKPRTKSEYLKDSEKAMHSLKATWEQLPKADAEVRLCPALGLPRLDGKGFTKEGLWDELRGMGVPRSQFDKLWKELDVVTGDVRKTKCCFESLEMAADRLLKADWLELERVREPEVRREDKLGGAAVTQADVLSMGEDPNYWQTLPVIPRKGSTATPDNVPGLLLRCIRPETRGLESCKTGLQHLRSDLLKAVDDQMKLQAVAIKGLLSACAPWSHAPLLPITVMLTGLITSIARG